MKKQFIKIALFAVVMSGIFTACKDDSDSTAPTITLNGRNPDSLEMLDTYVDLGATATDDQDGNITSSISTNSTGVNEDFPGSYTVYYSVSDAAGNSASASRTVVTYASPTSLAKNYTVKDTCFVGAASTPFAYSQSPIAFNGTQIKFNKFGDYLNNTNIVATINRDGTITMASQTANNIGTNSQDHTFSGTGYVTATGFYLQYTDNNLTTSSTATCKAHFTRL